MIQIDLMILADIGNPKLIAEEIIKENKDISLPIQIEEIAKVVGIKEIKYIPNAQFEGALVANSGKTEGIIACKAEVNIERKRFTIAHELGHFLIPTHSNELTCETSSISYENRNKFINKEQEANCFASNILVPQYFLEKELSKIKYFDLEELCKLREKFLVSYEAFIRALVNCCDEPMAFIFAEDQIIKFFVCTSDFPYLSVRPKSKLPIKLMSNQNYELQETIERDCDFWLSNRISGSLYEQNLILNKKYSITMLTLD